MTTDPRRVEAAARAIVPRAWLEPRTNGLEQERRLSLRQAQAAIEAADAVVPPPVVPQEVRALVEKLPAPEQPAGTEWAVAAGACLDWVRQLLAAPAQPADGGDESWLRGRNLHTDRLLDTIDALTRHNLIAQEAGHDG